jgi:hypothetical protein
MSNKLNLDKLLYNTPNIEAAIVQMALERVFPVVRAEYRNEPFFFYQLRCCDETGRTRLIIRFGWSHREGNWYFEPLAVYRREEEERLREI